MSNSIFNMLNHNQNNLFGSLTALQQNPFKFLMERKLNIPEGMNDPQQIIQYWLNNGTMSQDQFNQLQSKVSQMTLHTI